jgi:hypothetical protein
VLREPPQEEGHLELTVSYPMPPQDRAPIGRVIPWVVLVVLLLAGLVLYFRYGAGVTPILDSTR